MSLLDLILRMRGGKEKEREEGMRGERENTEHIKNSFVWRYEFAG